MEKKCDLCLQTVTVPDELPRPPLSISGAFVCDECAAEEDWDTEEDIDCEECGGSGRSMGQECEYCDGTGIAD